MKLHKCIPIALLLGSVATLASENAREEMAMKKEGVEYIKMLGGALKGELQAKFKSDQSGLSAMAFCATQATEITQSVNAKLPAYASVRRTALKTRNESNLPDATDKKVMEAYEASIAAQTFHPDDIKIVEDGSTTRVYKPLMTDGVCLKCHGDHIAPEIQKVIDAHYPHDKAVAFKAGSLRGVIVAEIKKH